MFMRCWVIYLFLHLIDKVSLQSQDETVYGVVGGFVILPCSYKERELKPDEINVFWRYNDRENVCDIEKGNFSTKKQDPLFKDRIESVSSEYGNGDFSIRLKHLKLTDNGMFSCFFETTKILKLQVNETAAAPTVNPTSSSMKAHPAATVTLLIFVGLKKCLNDHDMEDIHLNQTMKIIQRYIFLLIWYQATESLTNIAVTLGADVNISCDLDIEEIYWYKLKLPDPPVLILRTYSSTYEGAEYKNSIFKDKYSVKTNSRLFIRNISTDELGVYYCVKTSEPRKFSNGTKIYISDSVQQNQTESDDAQQHQAPWRTVTITSVLLNVLLIIALIGMVKRYITGRSKQYTAAQNSNNPKCVEVDLLMCAGNTCPEQSTAVLYCQ
ncbi:hypothetical protein Q8A67_006179 [Cirrhinus molitorella]|uniref:Ig-like domain-containing protein n=1 Tax=Cirrhinus molitorella TaxID=172907 RepID=A0AA88TUF7_9TELE|nr:hypothetical protein Q8A67_006179 [Cirrhinus molitorella]